MNLISSVYKKIKRHILSIYISLFLPPADVVEFNKNYQDALIKYIANKDTYSYNKFLMPEWAENTNTIEKYFTESFSVSFLRHQLLKSTMFAHLPKAAKLIQKKLITSYFGKEKTKEYLQESLVGAPILNDLEYKTSGNNIHHLYHLSKFAKEMHKNLSDIKSYIELGGGYGNMAKLVKHINKEATYIIIDIPIFSYIQYIYLSTVLGKEHVVFFGESGEIIPGKINLIPLDNQLIQQFISLKYSPDVFISTWALSESNQATQSLVRDNDYFQAEYLLLAYQKANDSFTFAQEVTKLNNNFVVNYNDETEYLSNNFYLFASRK